MNYFYQCNKESAKVWNKCVRLSKELWKTEGKYSDRKYLQDNIQGNFSSLLPAHVIQIIIAKYLSACVNIARARKQGRTDLRYPYKEKKYYNTLWDYMIFKVNYENNIISFTKPKMNKKLQKPINIKIKNIPQNVVRIELIFDKILKLALIYWEEKEIQQTGNNTCAIDLGEIHAITTIDSNGNSLIITGREIRSIQRFQNKEYGKLQSKISRCKKGSNQYKKYRKAIINLKSKTNAKKKNCFHKISKMFVDYCINNNIKTVVIGDLTKFNMNLDQRKERKGNKQRLVQWTHGILIYYLTYKLKNEGIELKTISEAYTSQTCPSCGNRYKPINRNYICKKCGYTQHRDIVGAMNIYEKYTSQKVIPKPLKYLRIAS
jgi:putative transposase